MTFPYIRALRLSLSEQNFYLAQNNSLPQEIYALHLSAASFDTNQQYWLQKGSGQPLQRVRVDSVVHRNASPVAGTLNQLDSQYDNGWRLYAGDSGSEVVVEQDESQVDRFEIKFSLG